MREISSLLPRLAALLLLAAAPLAAPALADDDVTVREDSAAFTAQGARWLSVEVPIGELIVRGGDGDRVQARLEVRCDEDSRRCRQRAAGIRLRPQRDDDELSLEVVGYPKSHTGNNPPQAYVELIVPRRLALRLELGVGEVEVRGLAGDLDLELGVGEARVFVAEQAVRRVGIDVGIGEANLSPRPDGTRSSRFLFLGNEVDWREGTGRANVDVEVGVGEATVRLLPD